ncbi:hypothetical protein RJ639_029656 [Escallonia herrerae]|uniref:F-box/kelch-repeat protein SKIP25 n=1 Tax=Escallonia herrerae TaxID=1293975 RepID=A0AA88X266_9ASTE|nr:hypothetical protein RJ639_029656 [Escallonia herrerae]
MANPIFTPTAISSTSTRSTVKRRKLDGHHQHDQQPLLPGLPDHIAQLCLSLVDPSTLYSVCRTWRRLIYAPSFPPFLSIYTLLASAGDPESICFSSFDPISSKWNLLPPPPPDPPLRLLFRHPSFISGYLPIQSVSIEGNLVLLAATTHRCLPALPRPLVFNPLSQKWSYGPPLATPRRWCAAGSSRGAVFVASGIGSHYRPDVARSVEKWDLGSHHNHKNGNQKIPTWEKMGPLKDGKFSREAIDAVGWRGKLCMVNVKGAAAKEGAVYDVSNDAWEDMPEGMIAGWRGPAAAMDEETIYVVEESKGVLKKYDSETDRWVVVLQSERLRGAGSVAAGGGRVCVVCSGGVGVVVIDVVASPPKLWEVDTPSGFQAVAIHLLPRLSQPDSHSNQRY